MVDVQTLREIYGSECEGRSDEEILRAYHRNFYGGMDYGEFQKQYEGWQKAKAERERSGAAKKAGGTGGKQKGFDPMV